ncbi:MAG TPA: glycosyltransferase family 2 protein [Terriglobales bacterium]|nr:glycosyltransferase family 2 protein [Terriglobales bacterium]
MQLSVVIITCNEEANIGRTLESVQALVADGKGEIIVVDSSSTDRTVEIAKSLGAKVFVEEWKGYAAQKNSAIDKATGKWILSLDADEEVEPSLLEELMFLFQAPTTTDDSYARFERVRALTYLSTRQTRKQMRLMMKAQGNPDSFFAEMNGYLVARKNLFLGRWIRHGGFWPDRKLRLFRRGTAIFEDRLVHEDITLTQGISGQLRGSLLHHSYPTLSDYIEHMNRYSSLGAEMVVAKGKVRFSFINIVLRPVFTFIYNYFFRLGFLDGREGLLLHLYHAVYVSWKYAKAWELSRQKSTLSS